MRSCFWVVRDNEQDPVPPQPTPFPIQIVPAPAPAPVPQTSSDTPTGKREDNFYPAWDKFLALEPKRAKKASRSARKIEEEKLAVSRSPGDGLHVKERAAQSWEQAAAACKAKVAAIVKECQRLNQKYRDAAFDIETNSYCLRDLQSRYPKSMDTIDPPQWIKRVEDIFDDPKFFTTGEKAADVHQGSIGDCWFLASLIAVTAKQELVDRLCVARDEKVGVYGFVFYRDGEWIYEVIDDKLFMCVGDDDDLSVLRDWDRDKKGGTWLRHDEDKLKGDLQRGGFALYFSHSKSNETWLPLIEKAYAKAHGDYRSIEGGSASEGIEDLTGGVGVVLNPEEVLDKDRFWRDQLMQVNKKYLFGGGSRSTATKGVVSNHAYAVLEAWEEGDLKLLKLRNPWGKTEWEGDWSDGSKLWTADMMTKLKHSFGDDGVFWISFTDFLKHFPHIHRVRLFDNAQWQVAQQWTCVNVPWTVNYLDTTFLFSISEPGPVVVVLCQPDERYFYGLEGRFVYSIHFRIYKDHGDAGGDIDDEEEKQYIVRSLHNSGNETDYNRSVSAEIEHLEPGTYRVEFKITAQRQDSKRTAEEAIQRYAIRKKDKLLDVGRKFDYAMAKGNLKSMEKEVVKMKGRRARDGMKSSLKKDRERARVEKARAEKRKERLGVAMKEKRKDFRKAKKELKARRKARKAEKKAKEVQVVVDAASDNGAGDDDQESVNSTKNDICTPCTEDGESSPLENAVEGKESEKTKDETAAPDIAASTSDDGREKLSDSLAKLDITQPGPVDLIFPPVEDKLDDEKDNEDDDGYESSIAAPEEMDINDFDWDSDMDGPAEFDTSSDDEEDNAAADAAQNAIFGEDTWNALCVLGLRVYSLNSEAKVEVVKGEGSS